jgi:hypothetical protein
MTGLRLLVVCAVLVSLALGCEESAEVQGSETSKRAISTTHAVTWADDDEREYYVTAYVIYSGHVDVLATKYGVDPLPEEVAKEYVRFFEGMGAIGAYHGCLDALRGAPNRGGQANEEQSGQARLNVLSVARDASVETRR